ncbi:Anthranilate synthase component 1 [Pirellulimonas nuda]|uniref:Anthranilate synthase component 1 n=1 Tax=Pirellulimonas nuda TaxID=2528009 RepID=A0A518D7Y8_9BACT|nr:anthranilate synthase component I [Pirellulimonas nuda]QDU87596.1 Anthranilate synthase component 1 [Pirellulimonas nuda]
MPHLPDYESFEKLAAGVDAAPVYRRLLSDSLTPVTAFHRLDTGGTACLFESVIGGEKVGRYSFLASEPYLTLEAHGEEVVLRHFGNVAGGAPSSKPVRTETQRFENPLDALRKLVASVKVAHVPGLPPFVGGAVGYAGYDTVRYVEDLPNAPQDDRLLPDLAFAFYDHMVVFDNVQKTAVVVALARVGEGADLRAAYDDAAARVDRLVDRLSAPPEKEPLPMADVNLVGAPTAQYQSNFTQAEYEAAVRKCVEYIRAGDIFQVVLSQRLQTPLAASPLEVYRTLRVVNPSPFMFFLRTPSCTLVGSSPEIMVRVADRKVTVRPLAGTRPRGHDEAEDDRLAAELLADPKERAEHVMLVDLGRNDVGRVAKYGTVELSDVMSIERYSHVMHITSNVTGELRDEADAFDALAACLPAGTVSGAPKVRAMEIIDELEPHRRGPYAGAVGYIDFTGAMDTCIALRTMVIKDGVAYIQAGAGLVADSNPTAEYEETLNKARGLLKAIEITKERTER